MTLGELFAGIANAIRSKDGTTDRIPALTFPERIMAISGGGGGNGGPLVKVTVQEGAGNEINVPVNISARVSVTAEKYYLFMLYNGVRLPRIPELSGYPYVFIQKGSSRYDLVFSKTKYWYQESDDSLRNSDYSGQKNYWLTFADFEAGATWSHRNDTGYYWQNFATRQVWSNYDIPIGSASGSNIKFNSTDPVPTD